MFVAFATPSFSLFLSAMGLETADGEQLPQGGADRQEYLEFGKDNRKNWLGEARAKVPSCKLTIGCGWFHRSVFAFGVRVLRRRRRRRARRRPIDLQWSWGESPTATQKNILNFKIDSTSWFSHIYCQAW